MYVYIYMTPSCPNALTRKRKAHVFGVPPTN